MPLHIYNESTHLKTWQVNQPPPGAELELLTIDRIQVDGAELSHIRTRFENLPAPVKRRVVTWYGDMARFIIGNL